MQRLPLDRPQRLLLALALVGCSGSVPPREDHKHPEPLSVAQHEEQAQAHEAQADSTEERIETAASPDEQVQCIDIGGPLESGGERMPVMKPCWTRAEQNFSYRRAAESHRRAAAEHREWGQKLALAEEQACSGLGEIESKTSPFVRGPDILSVEPVYEGKTLRGATVTFRKVVGLSKPWLEKSMKCHRARAAKLGFAADFMSHSPLSLRDTTTSVVESADTVTATLRSEDPIVAAEIYGRALFAASDEETRRKDGR